MVMIDGGSNYDLSDYVIDATRKKGRKGCTDFGDNPEFAFTDKTLMRLGYSISESGRLLGPKTTPSREYGIAQREISYKR